MKMIYSAMEMRKMTISGEQAKTIATAVYSDIRSFIENNRAEYEAWLKQEQERQQIRSRGEK